MLRGAGLPAGGTEYFGERVEPCSNRDACLDPSERIDGTRDAQKILSRADRSGERFGTGHLIYILRGTETEKIVGFGHHRPRSFGADADRGKKEWRVRHYGQGSRPPARRGRRPVP